MDLISTSPRLPAFAALLQVLWFIVLSVARVRMGGTSAIPIVKLIDLLIPLPAVVGLLSAMMQLWQMGGGGGPWLWGGALACACLCAVFIRIRLS